MGLFFFKVIKKVESLQLPCSILLFFNKFKITIYDVLKVNIYIVHNAQFIPILFEIFDTSYMYQICLHTLWMMSMPHNKID